MKQVNGVKQVSVSFKDKQAVVIFDNEKTNIKALTQATTNAGYPSVVKKAVCEADKACAEQKTRRNQRIIFWVISVLLIALMTFPWYASLFFN